MLHVLLVVWGLAATPLPPVFPLGREVPLQRCSQLGRRGIALYIARKRLFVGLSTLRCGVITLCVSKSKPCSVWLRQGTAAPRSELKDCAKVQAEHFPIFPPQKGSCSWFHINQGCVGNHNWAFHCSWGCD